MEASVGRLVLEGQRVEVACGVVRMEGWRMEAVRVKVRVKMCGLWEGFLTFVFIVKLVANPCDAQESYWI